MTAQSGLRKVSDGKALQLLLVSRKDVSIPSASFTGKNNRFPFWDSLVYLKNTHKNPKFGRVRQVPGWDLSHFAKFGIFMGILLYPKISKNGNPLFFAVFRIYFVVLLQAAFKNPANDVFLH